MNREQANKAAKSLLEYIAAMDPTWADRIEITRSERGWDYIQTLGSYVATTLDGGQFLMIPMHSFFEVHQALPNEDAVCPVCEKTYRPAYVGQNACMDSRCGIEYNRRLREKAAA